MRRGDRPSNKSLLAGDSALRREPRSCRRKVTACYLGGGDAPRGRLAGLDTSLPVEEDGCVGLDSGSRGCRGRRALEVGCGDGRLTWRYARKAAAVLAVDSDDEAIATARVELPGELGGRVRFEVVSALDLNEPPGSFDVAILSWSL